MVIFERCPTGSYLYKGGRKDLKWWTAHRWNVWRLRQSSGQSTFAMVYWCQLDVMGAYVHVRRENAHRPVRPQSVAAAVRLVLRKLLSDHPMLLCTVPEDNPRMARLLSRLGFRTLARYDDRVEPGRAFLLLARWRDGAVLLPLAGGLPPA